jgi:zinc protease
MHSRQDLEPHSIGPAISDEASWSDRTLANGLRVVLLADANSPTVALTVGYHVGGKDDPSGRSGFAHLFEHLMFKGTSHSPAETMDRLTEDVGGFNNAYTTADLTMYYEVVPANYLEVMLWAEADRLSSLIVDEANFATEREVVIGEFDQRILAEPYGMLDEIVERQMFAGHAYANGVIGDPDSLRASQLEDVLAFHRTYYRSDNAVLVVVGDLDIAQTNAWVDMYFGQIERPQNDIPRVPMPVENPTIVERMTHRAANVPLTAFNYAYHLPSVTDKDAAVIDILECILGYGKSSRLNRALVHDTQLAAQAFTDADMREQSGLFQIRAVLHADESLAEAEAIVRRELARICAEDVEVAELRRAQNQLASVLVRRSETPNDRSLLMATDALMRGNPRAMEQDARDYTAATVADIRRVANRIFSQTPAVLEYRGLAENE